MYERFYGLRERPFDLVPNPRFLFLTARQREASSNLRYGLTTPRGLTLLLGEAGTGKTTIVHAMLAELDVGSVQCVLLSNPTLTRGEFYEYLAQGFGLSAEAGQSKTRFLFDLRRHLLERHNAGQLTALVLDEAQSLPGDLLEEIRLLSNIETDTFKLLNVVLAGQPELAARLNEPRLRQLKQRISLRCELAPLDFNETAAYIAGRIRIAGGDPVQIFSREAVLAIHEASHGVPRTINVVCDNALINGFAVQTRPIVRTMVDEVCRDFSLAPALREGSTSPEGKGHSAAGAAGSAPGAADIPSPAAPATIADAPTPMFGTVRKRRFSFF